MAASHEEAASKKDPAFSLQSMIIRDASSGRVLWQGDEDFAAGDVEHEARLPKRVLQLDAVSREVVFYSRDELHAFRLEQDIFLKDQKLEEWRFDFGFVIPGSTNSWQNTIEADKSQGVLPASVLSGNVVIETRFLDGDRLINSSRVRVYYV